MLTLAAMRHPEFRKKLMQAHKDALRNSQVSGHFATRNGHVVVDRLIAGGFSVEYIGKTHGGIIEKSAIAKII